MKDSSSTAQRLRNHRQYLLLALLVLIAIGTLVFVGMTLQQQREANRQRSFVHETERVTTKLGERLFAYTQILRAGAGFFAGAGSDAGAVTRAGWTQFVAKLDLDQSYRGIQGVGFSLAIPAQDLPAHLREIRQQGFPDYVVKPEGEREIYSSIIYLEPFTGRNLRAFGYDMFSEPTRRAAMTQARDTGDVACSGKVLLVQETKNDVQSGLLAYFPVYRNGALTQTVEQRRAALVGWVYSPYRVNDLLMPILDSELNAIHLEIFDGELISEATLLFDSEAGKRTDTPAGANGGTSGGTNGATDGAMASLVTTQKVEFAGRTWTLRYSPLPGFTAADHGAADSQFERISLLIIGGLVLALALALVRTRQSANTIAQKLTISLRASEARYNALFASSQVPMLLIDPLDGRIVEGNSAAAEFYGYRREQLQSLPMAQINALSAEEIAAETALMVHAGRPCLLVKHRCADERVRDVEVYSGPVVVDGQQLLYAIVHDVTDRRAMEVAIAELNRDFLAFLDNTSDFIYFKDRAGHFRFCSQTLAQITQHASWRDMVGKHDRDVFPADTAKIYEEEERPIYRDGVPLLNKEDPYYRADGSPGWVSTNKWPVKDAAGAVVGLFGISRDITMRRQTEERLRLAANVFSSSSEGIMVTDAQATIIEVNEAFTRITGYERDEVLGQKASLLSSGRQDAAFYASLWQTLNTTGHWRGELWNRRKSGELIAELLTISAIRNPDGEPSQYVGLFSDITRIKENEKRLEHIAHYDTLTALPTRLLMLERLHHAMARVKREGSLLALVFIDLDGFREINDQHGHDAGDILLVTLAARLSELLRPDDTISRIGGDEFVVLLNSLSSQAESLALIVQLLEAAQRPMALGDEHLQVSASIGASFYPQTADIDSGDLLRQAERAMSAAKLAGKNCYRLYEAAL